MSVGVMEDYKLRDLRASHTLDPPHDRDLSEDRCVFETTWKQQMKEGHFTTHAGHQG